MEIDANANSNKTKKFRRALIRGLMAAAFTGGMIAVAKYVSVAIAAGIMASVMIGFFVFAMSYTNPFED